MVKTFVEGNTTSEGLTITWQDSETGKRIYEDIDFNDYFYIKLDDFYTLKDELKNKWKHHIKAVTEVNAYNQNYELDSFAKIILKDNSQKYFIKTWIEDDNDMNTYEADLNTTKRYIIDNHKNMELNILQSRFLFYDIETDDRNFFKYDERNRIVPENTILSIAATDFEGKSFFFINKDSKNPSCEKAMLEEFAQLVKNYSVVIGYNSDIFDDIYIQGRCKLHNMTDLMLNVNNLDFMFSYKKYRIEQQLDSYSLDNVAKVELNEEKVDVRKGGGRLYNLYLTDKEKLKEYNIQDSMLLYRLNKKLKFVELHLQTAQLGCCNVQLTKYNIGSNDYFVLMKCKERNIIAPSNPTKSEVEKRRKIGSIGGGYTRGVPGLYDNVGTFDFSSLYPSLEITYNISPETFVQNATIEADASLLEPHHKNIQVFKDYNELKNYADKMNYIVTPSDLTYVSKRGREVYHPYRFFKGDFIGLLPAIMIELLDERAKIRKAMKSMKMDTLEYDRAYNDQLAKKYMLNSNYGLNALPSYRFFRWDVADAITSSGRVNTKRIRKFAEENNFTVIYSDTDSIGITPDKENSHFVFDVAKKLLKDFDEKLVKFIDETLSLTNNKVYKREDKYGIHNHRLILEWEKTFKILLYKKKKRYAGLIVYDDGTSKINIVGLESTQMNVLAAKLQDEFIDDILNNKFDVTKWKIKMSDLHKKCFRGEIEPEYLVISKKFTDRAENQKVPRAHTLLAERLIKEGYDVAVGDKIKYIVESVKPKQHAVTLEEFKLRKTYPTDYYWEIFTSPIISLMSIIKNIDVLDIVYVPELQKLIDKLNKYKNEGKNEDVIMKLMERINKKKESLLDNEVDENEEEDTLMDNQYIV